MGNANYIQDSFLGGEWGKLAQGNYTHPKYKTAMAKALNGYPIEEQCYVRRPGFMEAAHTRAGLPGRVIPYKFAETAAYNMELTDGHLRFLRGLNLISTIDGNQLISSISTARPAVVSIPDVTWANDDTVTFMFGNATSAKTCPLLANRQFTVQRLSAGSYSLYDALTGAPIDGSTLGWVSGLVIFVARVQDLATPYTNNTWEDVRSVQNEKIALLLTSVAHPQTVRLSTEPSSISDGEFVVTPTSFVDGPYLDPIKGSWMTPSQTTGVVNVQLLFQPYDATVAYSAGDYVTSSAVSYKSLVDANQNHTPASSPTFWTPVSPGVVISANGFVETDVGRAIRMFSEPPLWDTTVTYNAGDVVTFQNVYWTALLTMAGATPTAGTVNTNQPGVKATTWAINPAAARWTWGRITSLSTSGLIDPALSGSTSIGNLLDGGGLAALFDGTINKVVANCANKLNASNGFNDAYGGKNFSGASAQTISSVVVYPSTDDGYISNEGGVSNITFELYGKSTAPASASDGTLLGSTTIGSDSEVPVTVVSTDTVTTWNYVWVRITYSATGFGTRPAFAQIRMYNASAVSGTSVNIQLLGDPLLYTTSIRTWRLGAYSDSTGWPTCGCYHEGRIWLSGAIKNRFDACKSNGVDDNTGAINFAPTDSNGAVGDSNAITYLLNSSEVNPLQWMIPRTEGILMGTKEGEWLVQATVLNNPLSPTNIQAHLVTSYGSQAVEPKRTGLTTVFVQKFGRRLLEYVSDAFSGRHYGPNLSEKAKHLARTGIKEIAYQEELTPIVWARTGAGKLIGCTYRRTKLFSSEAAEFAGWHRHELGFNCTVESIAVGPSTDGLLDTLAMVVNDTDTNIRHTLLAMNLMEEDDGITAANYLDNSKTPISGETITVDGKPVLRFHGLWHLNGKTVSAFIAGLDCGDLPVIDGHIDVPYSANPLLTKLYLSKITTDGRAGAGYGLFSVDIDGGDLTIPALIGFTYTTDGQVLRPIEPALTGAQNGPALGKLRRAHQYGALLHNTQGTRIGTRFDKMFPIKMQTPGGSPLPANVLFSGVVNDTIDDDTGFDNQICWRTTRMFPCNVLAIGPFIQTADK